MKKGGIYEVCVGAKPDDTMEEAEIKLWFV